MTTITTAFQHTVSGPSTDLRRPRRVEAAHYDVLMLADGQRQLDPPPGGVV